MAAAAQQAQRANTSTQTNGQIKNQKQNEPKKTISQAAGIGIMVVLLVASLFIGNFRALQSATPASFLKQGAVASIVEDRATAAKNAEVVAKRADLDNTYFTAVESAVSAFSDAKSARDLSRANQSMITAVSEMTASAKSGLSDQDQKSLQRAMDDFDDQGNMLREEARNFNAKADKAIALYNQLPTRFLLSKPDYFEGL